MASQSSKVAWATWAYSVMTIKLSHSYIMKKRSIIVSVVLSQLIVIVLCFHLTAEFQWLIFRVADPTNSNQERRCNCQETLAPHPKPAETTDSVMENFAISQNGFWSGTGSVAQHIFDPNLAGAMYKFFKAEKAQSILDLGAGLGNYSQYFNARGLMSNCYDGNPDTQILSGGNCAVVDLTKSINFASHDWVLSLEVGEHLPKIFEDVFLQSLDRVNRYGIIISWGVPGQGGAGHVNTQTNGHLLNKFSMLGYKFDTPAMKNLRAASSKHWFNYTLMVFRKFSTDGSRNFDNRV